MAPTTSDECLSFLDEAKQALENISDLNARETDCRQREQQSQRAYDAEKKKMNDEISRTLKSRREEIVKSYNDEIAKDQDQLKKAKTRREKAKNEGVKGRIADETAGFEKDITSLRSQIRNLAQTEHLPGYCHTRLYMSLYYPKHPRDILALFIGILIFFALIPCAVYFMIPDRKPLYLAFIYIVLLVVVVGIYVLIGSHARKNYPEALKDCRGLYDQIYEKQKAIRSTAKSIKNDKSEGSYDLAKYDDDISKIQQDLNDVTGRKQEALDNYENVTKNILSDEIEGNYRDKLTELSHTHEEAEKDLRDVIDELKTARLNVSDNYSQLLGKEFTDPSRIDSLIQIVKDQNCQNISEAVAYYKANEKQIRADKRAWGRKSSKAAAADEAALAEDTEPVSEEDTGPAPETSGAGDEETTPKAESAAADEEITPKAESAAADETGCVTGGEDVGGADDTDDENIKKEDV